MSENIDKLAQEIRRVDGSHSLGAGALAEALWPYIVALRAAPAPVDPERVAQLIAHRACCGTEADPANGKLHGYCVVCGVDWPCEYAGKPPTPAAAPAPVDGMHALISHWRSRDSGDGFDGLDYDRGVIETLLNCADDLERLLAAPTSAATPGEAAHGEQGVPDYFHVQEVAHEFGIDYNRLCAAIKALTPPAAAPGALNAAMVERASLAYEVAMDGEVYRPEVPRIAMEAALTAALAQQPPASGSRGVDGGEG